MTYPYYHHFFRLSLPVASFLALGCFQPIQAAPTTDVSTTKTSPKTQLSKEIIQKATPPKVVAVPPSDASRGLVRVNKKEIRHYTGTKKEIADYLVSKDNGLTWTMAEAKPSYPKNYGGIPKESPAIEQNPVTKEYIRVQPINGFVFLSKGGLDGQWFAVTKSGTLEADWKDEAKRKNLLTLGGIMRNPLYIRQGKRILIPAHSMGQGTFVHYSDDGGLTWKRSKNTITSPAYEAPNPPHQGKRWRNAGLEASLVELKNGKIWALTRTDQDQYWEAFSEDGGETWSKAAPSRFFGTLTMPTLGRLSDGRLIALWTNTMALPECKRSTKATWEDVFTNRDSHHIALSSDEGKTWIGFREFINDEHRNDQDYATKDGAEDRGKHQSEFLELSPNKILVSCGQHKNHRRLMIIDLNWVYQKTRQWTADKGLDDWTIHTYIPQVKGHCSYNRKPSAELVDNPTKSGEKALLIQRLDDPSLVNEKDGINYQKGGATWNFPNGTQGIVQFTFYLPKELHAENSGVQISLTDRLFNACDEYTKDYALYTLSINNSPKPSLTLGTKIIPVTPGQWHTLTLQWKGTDRTGTLKVSLDKKAIGSLPLQKSSPNGASYLHFISTAESADHSLLIDQVKAQVK